MTESSPLDGHEAVGASREDEDSEERDDAASSRKRASLTDERDEGGMVSVKRGRSFACLGVVEVS